MSNRIEEADERARKRKREVAADGERVSIGLMQMDSVRRAVAGVVAAGVRHSPGQVAVLSDAERAARIAAAEARDAALADAWKNPPEQSLDDFDQGVLPEPKVPGEHPGYAKRDRELEQAWKGDSQ